MNKRLRLPLALSLALASGQAAALGLGQIEVKSALNQPLSAEIPVLSSQAGEADNLVVRLAPPEALARVGLQAPTGVAANLEFSVGTNLRGEKVIRVTTPGKVADPFVSFLVEVDWGSGKMLREYTVLLDPPTMAPVRHTSTAAPVSAPTEPSDAETVPLPEAPPPPEMREQPQPVAEAPATPPPAEPVAEPQPDPEPVAEAEPAPPPPEPAPVAEPAPAGGRVDNYGPVQGGDTLWQIASYARPDSSVSMNQMMLALLAANPDAFIGQNINRLKRGAILRIPSKEETLAVAAAEAAAQVREQAAAWRGEAAPSVLQPAEPQVDDVAAAPAAAAPAVSDSRLELVPPRADTPATGGAQSGASVAGEGNELRAELARSREQVSTLSQENVELKARVGELEKIEGDSQRLLQLKDSELAAAQQRLRELEAQAASAAAAPATPAASADAAAAPDASVATSDTAIDPSVPPMVEPPATTDASLANGTRPADVAAPEAAPTDAPVSTVTPTDAVPAETTPATPATDTAPAPVAAAPIWQNPWVLGGIVLVVVGLLALLLGRRRPVASAAAARHDTAAVASSIAGVQAHADRDLPPPSLEGDDHLDDLVAAVSRDPGNLARHLELVRYYYDANDAAGFENAAEAMYSRVYDPDDLAWKQVVAMGHEIAPEHPLFIIAEEAPAEPEFEPELPAPIPPPVVDVVPAPAPLPPVREIDWGQPAPAPAFDAGATQQMRIDDVRDVAPAPAEGAFEDEPDLGDSFSYEPAPAEPADGSAFVDADAASTKLELARAYLDMGDVEGARGMLEEVVSEGNPGQRAEAKRLLDEIR